jgi:PAS domain S-box-containing protein
MPTSFTKWIRILTRRVRQSAAQSAVLALQKNSVFPIKTPRHARLDLDAQEELRKRMQAVRRMELQHAVSQVLMEAANLDDVAPQLLQAIGERLGWELGMLWNVDQQARQLRCSTIWRAPSITAIEFEAVSQQTSLPPNVGLPGHVWAHGEPVGITDVLKDSSFLRLKAATKDSLHGAFAFPIQGRNGILGVIEFYSHEIQPPDPELLGTVATLGNQIGQFIERHQAEAARRMSEERFRLLAEQAQDVIYRYRMLPTRGWEYISPASSRVSGYTPEEHYADPHISLKIIHPDDRPRFEDAIKAGSGPPLELRWIRKDGAVVWTEQRNVPFYNECGTLVAVEGIARDITERKQAEEALRMSEARIRAMLETAIDGIFTIDHQARIVEWNSAAEQMFGYSRDEALGREMPKLIIPPVLRDECRQGLAHYFATGESQVIGQRTEMAAMRADGSQFDVELAITRIPSNGTPMFTAFVRDITQRKQAEETHRRYHEQLEFLSRRLLEAQEHERRHIARELHDEIGQSLTGLKLVLEMTSRLPHDQAQDSLSQAKALVTELMACVRALSLDLRPGMLDDLGLLPALLWHFERYTAQMGVRVLFSHHGLERRFAPAVETAAYRIVQEALTNVARYAGVREAAVQLWADDDMFGVEIEDQGVGFDAHAALDANTSSGLTGMRERAMLVGGRLIIEATPRVGTRVRAEFPLNCQR